MNSKWAPPIQLPDNIKYRDYIPTYGEPGNFFAIRKHMIHTEKTRSDIRNHNHAMLHVELFSKFIDRYQIDHKLHLLYLLRDPTPYLMAID